MYIIIVIPVAIGAYTHVYNNSNTCCSIELVATVCCIAF